MAATLADVAKRSGVSVATASRVLNNKMAMPIPPETVERIRLAAHELHYKPNLVARALATGRTHAIGLYTEEMTDPHFAQMLEAVESTARSRGHHLIVTSSLDQASRRGVVDGSVILGHPNEEKFADWRPAAPAVFVYSAWAAEVNLVGWSDAEGMYLATRHLLALGHRRIVGLFCYGGDLERQPAKVEGFRKAIAEYGKCTYFGGALRSKVEGFRRAMSDYECAPVECNSPPAGDPSNQETLFEHGYREVQALLRRGEHFTAIVARNDFLAIGALRALREFGLVVPRDVSVIGYTDSIHAVCADPPLTSVRTPIAEAGKIAVDLLLRMCRGSEKVCDGALLPPVLVERQSCAPPSGSDVDQALIAELDVSQERRR